MAHVWAPPALIALKVPSGGEAWPCRLSPQQATVPPIRRAHVWNAPALIALKVPEGGEDCPSALDPQQTTLVRAPGLSVRMAHV
jgi:hypothetical protein